MMGDDDYKDMGFGSGDAELAPDKAKPRITREQSLEAARRSGFAPPVEGTSSTAHGRRRRRGAPRDKNLTVRTYSQTIDDFYEIAEANRWGLGETLEHLVKHYAESKG